MMVTASHDETKFCESVVVTASHDETKQQQHQHVVVTASHDETSSRRTHTDRQTDRQHSMFHWETGGG